ncbi:MAG TPA: YqaA family protein [Candidatus Ozemobacteraceae bacterium]|nr:YqaA family protein [Candidatus Ozemobacteraceae bacterium]HQG29619.1 YqaA family protein [Candidatus Ozemobacteraceae bacterium]
MKYIRRLYDWTLALAARPGAIWALFAIAFAESSFFPIPPDVLLIAMTLAQPSKGLWYATVCTAGSVIGAMFGYLIGYGFWAAVGGYFFKYVPGFTPEIFEQVCRSYEQYSVLIVFTAAFTPIPYKVITITAGVSHISLLPFIVASAFGRGARFFLVSGLLMKFGPPVKEFIEKYFNLLTVLVVAIYVLAFYLLPVLFK